MKKIDSHQHVFWHGRDDRGLVADLDEHEISRAWLLTWNIAPSEDSHHYHVVLNPSRLKADGTHPGIVLDDLLIARDRYPDRFEIGYCPHPLLGNACRLLEAAVKMYGVRVCGEWKFRLPFDDPRCLELFRAAGALDLPVVLHLDVPFLKIQGVETYQPLWYGGSVDALERALKACPKTIFIGHAPGFWREISADADEDPDQYPTGSVVPNGKLSRLFENYSNLYADLSAGSGLGALRRDRAHAEIFLKRYADRLLFARDYYGGELLTFLSQLSLDGETQERIYFKNAESLLERSTPSSTRV